MSFSMIQRMRMLMIHISYSLAHPKMSVMDQKLMENMVLVRLNWPMLNTARSKSLGTNVFAIIQDVQCMFIVFTPFCYMN